MKIDLSRRALLQSSVLGGLAISSSALLAHSPGSGASGATAAASGWATSLSQDELVPLRLFADSGFNDEVLFALGAASSRSAEVGEVIRIAQSINAKSGNPVSADVHAYDQFYDGFGRFADQLDALAAKSRSAVTARHRYLRASTYAAQQLFFVLGTSDGQREQTIFNTVNRRWTQALERWQPRVVRFSAKSAFGDLPGYLFRPSADGEPRPTVIISEGSDGQNVESLMFGVTAALERDYNVVLFEGPGQMSLLFERQTPFTPDWDQVVGPVLRWAKRRSDVGPVALIGISFGGMLCARAGAKLDGLDALVLEPGAHSFSALWGDHSSIDTVRQTRLLPAKERQEAETALNEGFVKQWPRMSHGEQFTIYKRGEIFDKRIQDEARAGKPPSNYYALIESILPFEFGDDLRAITIPTMVTANQGDEFFADQSGQAFDMLDRVPASRKVLAKFTAAQGAQLHDQPFGPQVVQESVFDWLDEQLSGR